jgi:serine/threonine-protein kinase
MREEPPRELIELVERLELATASQVAGVRRRAARLAQQLPLFESVWVDALAQARLVSPYQAAEINAGRGESLAVGPYVLTQPLPSPGYVQCYQARQRGSQQTVHLAMADCPSADADARLGQLKALTEHCGRLDLPTLAAIHGAGLDDRRLWVVSRHVAGRTAGDWLVSNGRFPPEVVLEIARQMLVGLVALERTGLCHGDISAMSVMLTDGGDVVLRQPGLRAIFRPDEGYAFADLLPEAYDCLAPERIANGTAPTPASDVYACGCLWWHMLAGRPPMPAGTSLAKLRAIQTADIPDIRLLAPETPLALASAISSATQRDPRLRHESMARLAAALGPPTRVGRAMLVRCLCRRGDHRDGWAAPASGNHRWRQAPAWMAVVGGVLVAAGAIGWSMWRARAADNPTAPVAAKAKTVDSVAVPSAGQESPSAPGNDPGRSDSNDAAQPPGAVATKPPDPARPASPPANRLILPTDGAVALDAKAVRPNQLITGEPGKRPLVAVPATGLVLSQENVRFENIDFVWESSAASGAAARPTAMIHLEASRAEFRGCSFQSARPEKTLPVAIAWVYPTGTSEAELSLPSGELRLSDCVLRHVAAGIFCRTRGALALNLSNLLDLAPGPLLQLTRWPEVDEPLVIRLSGVTLRESGPLVQGPCVSGDREAGRVTVIANGCALVPADGAALVSLLGAGSPEKTLKNLEWSGQGSLVSPDTPIAAWQEGGRSQVLDDAAISIAGLVRSEVEFAGSAEAGPAASSVVRWQVPLQSANAPGADPDRLAEPKR